MAAKWHDFEQSGDRYDLQYRTAGDEAVRAGHQAMHDITLPQSDPFWSQFLPPNGWNCRCTVVQVRKNKYPTSDSAKAIEVGESITSEPKAQIFRFNPGKELKLYPDKHPYYKADERAKKIISDLAIPIKTKNDLVFELERIANNSDWFARGFMGLYVETNRGNNGSTDLNGNIWLKASMIKNCVSAVDKLKRGGVLKENESLSVCTLWHEITHNRNKHKNMNIDKRQTRAMECANEFIARNTLPEFYAAFGAKVQHEKFMKDRENTSYNKMVRNYQDLIEMTGADTAKTLETLKRKSFNAPLSEQENCLVESVLENANIIKKNGNSITKKDAEYLVGSVVQFGDYGVLKSRIDDIVNRE